MPPVEAENGATRANADASSSARSCKNERGDCNSAVGDAGSSPDNASKASPQKRRTLQNTILIGHAADTGSALPSSTTGQKADQCESSEVETTWTPSVGGIKVTEVANCAAITEAAVRVSGEFNTASERHWAALLWADTEVSNANQPGESEASLETTAADEDEEDEIVDDPPMLFQVKWGCRTLQIQLPASDFDCFTVADFKERIQQISSVPADKQKILGVALCRGGVPTDTSPLSSLIFRRPGQLTLVGSTLATLERAAEEERISKKSQEAFIDFDSGKDNSTDNDHYMLMLQQQQRRRLKRIVSEVEITFLNAPRQGKKLLVIDLDYTLFDCKGPGTIEELKRPFLEHFMKSAYEHFDLAIWSQTHWRWVEMKCTELGLLSSSLFKLCFVLDRSSMFTVSSRYKRKPGDKAKVGDSSSSSVIFKTPDGNEMRNHEVKALQFIWSKCPMYSAHNTLHVDDLSRNFALNPQNGLKIRPFRCADRFQDRELLLLSFFLRMAAEESDVCRLNNKRWRDIAISRIQRNPPR